MQNLKPKKFLGQHFLTDENIARKIVAGLEAPAAAPVVEIGPGGGVLTKYLVAAHPDFQVVEFDGEAVAVLTEKFTGLRIHHADFLQWQPDAHLTGPTWFIGNLPYNVSSPIFFHLLAHMQYVQRGCFMVQKEVAERITAPSGGKEYGILSVLLGAFFKLKYAFTVSEKVFYPRPRVLSAVFTMERLPQADPATFPALARVVKAGFNQRRKTLRNALRGLPLDPDAFPAEWLDLRAEQLSIPQFQTLAAALRSTPHEP